MSQVAPSAFNQQNPPWNEVPKGKREEGKSCWPGSALYDQLPLLLLLYTAAATAAGSID